MKNLYLETARPQVAAPALSENITADVAIVGGGYTGVSAALHLAEQGISVALVEAGEIGHGCSGRNGGQVNPGLKVLPDTVKAHWGTERGERMNRMASDATSYVFDLIEKYGIDCAPSRTGTIRAAIDAAGVRQVRALADQCSRDGLPVRYVDAAEMANMTGTTVYKAGAFDARGGHVNPLAYTRGLALAAQQAKARLYANSRATALSKSGPSWIVTTEKGKITASDLIVCTNGYTGDLWPGMRQALIPVYTYIAATDPLPEHIRRTIMPCGSALYEAAWDVVYYRVDDAGRLLMGGRGPQRDARTDADYRHLVDYAFKLWPQLKGTTFPWSWHGQVAITQDHFPHLVAPEKNVHLMFGYNGRGIAVSTMAGHMLAERIASGGTADVDLSVRDRLTPVPFHDFWRTGAEITMSWNRLKDWVRGR
ncbi:MULTISPECIES: NAD(P)/FAD-dependent oxidoreductase [Alphaproteobacteria]|uniref:Oxidoreductase n=2 Tax=Alphaproteobacteria TaxID=28211 RepID=A0A512HN25_9HYPH|nr:MULTISPECIES: FAD-binding oxidoreductase [Alphaproteobacteria]GEO86843.1 oxidoreductase [Ciceribacter naphthalenivorans]GLR23987.1 oxidoreductase [Ciceribacter naphthalenivorans]GLT06843.1 oxidoreductase [Sphingomonas psychrolutea]